MSKSRSLAQLHLGLKCLFLLLDLRSLFLLEFLDRDPLGTHLILERSAFYYSICDQFPASDCLAKIGGTSNSEHVEKRQKLFSKGFLPPRQIGD